MSLAGSGVAGRVAVEGDIMVLLYRRRGLRIGRQGIWQCISWREGRSGERGGSGWVGKGGGGGTAWCRIFRFLFTFFLFFLIGIHGDMSLGMEGYMNNTDDLGTRHRMSSLVPEFRIFFRLYILYFP